MLGGPCTEHGRPRAYVAAPIFTPSQLDDVEAVVAVLHDRGYVSYSPARDGVLLTPDDPAEKRDEVFYSNRVAIEASDVLVCLLDTKDTGTIWEIGLATGRNLPIIAVTLQQERMNVMLERGVIAHVTSLESLYVVLDQLTPFVTYGRKMTTELQLQSLQQHLTWKDLYSFRGETE